MSGIGKHYLGVTALFLVAACGDSERTSPADGLAADTSDAVDVSDAIDATDRGDTQLPDVSDEPVVVTLDGPRRALAGVPIPLVVRAEPATTRVVHFNVDGHEVAVPLYHGRGSVSITLDHDIDVAIADEGVTFAPGQDGSISVIPPESASRRIDGELMVAAGDTLTINAGDVVTLGPLARIIVAGRLEIAGTAEAPVLFTSDGEAPWGAIEVRGGTAVITHAWFTGGGGRAERFGGHSSSDPVLAAVNGTLTMQGGGIVDNPGKALWAEFGRVNVDDVLISRCDTGGEYVSSVLTMTHTHVLEIPDGDGAFDDDDNDGTYLRLSLETDGIPEASHIADSVFAVGEDDGIDHNGATVLIERVVIDGFRHEGVAASTGGTVTIRDTIVRNCQQGIEAGYGEPYVDVKQTLVTGNEVGLRWGDEYGWEALGTLIAEGVMAVGNTRDIRMDDDQQGDAPAGKFSVGCSVVDDPDWAARDANIRPSEGGLGLCPAHDALPSQCTMPVGPEVCQ